MEIGTTKKKHINPDVQQKRSKASVGLPQPISNVQIKTKKYREPNGRLGDVILKSESMSKELKKGVYRAIRYIKGAVSIFVDEQGDVTNHVITPIVMFRGEILVEDPLLIAYMDATVQNMANGGKRFKEDDPVADARRELEMGDLLADADHAARKLSITKLKALTRALGLDNVSKLEDDVIRLWAVKYARKDLAYFVSMIESPLPEVIEVVSIGFEKGIIELGADKSTVKWKSAGGSFLGIPPGFEEERVEFIAQHLLSKEGAEVLDTLKKAINKK